MTDEWLSYAEAAERLHTTPQGARQRAIRGRWQKTIGNDKKPRIRLPDGWADTVRTATEHIQRKPANAVRTATEHVIDPALVDSLREHIETLKAQLAAAEARASEEAAKTGQAVAAVEAHNATLKADVDKLEGLLTSERERVDRAIAAFEQLAQRLETMAEATRPSWWSWLRFGFLD